MSKEEKSTIRDKSNYVTNLIRTNGRLINSDHKAYNYLYDIVTFLVHRKINTKMIPSDFPEEVIQNILVQLFERFGTKKKANMELNSIFPYISTCVMSELCKLRRNKYQGQAYILSGYDLDLDKDETGEFSICFMYEAETFAHFLRVVKTIVREVRTLLNETIIPVENKELLLFPLLLAIMREDERIFIRYNIRIRSALRYIYREIGNPLLRIRA